MAGGGGGGGGGGGDIYFYNNVKHPPIHHTISETSTGQIHHHYEDISGATITISENTPMVPPNFSIISDHLVGIPSKLSKQSWFYGNITKKQAEVKLPVGSKKRQFLVRHTSNALILSSRIGVNSYHDIIEHGPDGYYLKGWRRHFKSVAEIVDYYRDVPITQDLGCNTMLGYICNRMHSGNECNELNIACDIHVRDSVRVYNRSIQLCIISYYLPSIMTWI